MSYSYKAPKDNKGIAEKTKEFIKKVKKLKEGNKRSVKQKKGHSRKSFSGPSNLDSLPVKKIFILASLLVVVGLVGFGITGLVSYSDDLESTLNSTQIKLQNTQNAKENCQSDLIRCAENKKDLQDNLSLKTSDLETCEYRLDNTNDSLEEVNETLQICEENLTDFRVEIADLEGDIEDEQDNYEDLVRNIVPDYCCGSGENVTKNWSLDGDDIDCNGDDYTVNCNTDEVDNDFSYPS